MRQLDEIDREILRILQSEGRVTNSELSKRVKLSAPTTHHRVRALERVGVIKGYQAIVDADRVGLRLTAYVQVTLTLHTEMPIERFIRHASEIPEIVECCNVSGAADFLLKVVVRDMKHYESLVREKISRIQGVATINSSFVMSKHKAISKLPI